MTNPAGAISSTAREQLHRQRQPDLRRLSTGCIERRQHRDQCRRNRERRRSFTCHSGRSPGFRLREAAR